jgi:hypothetical protein
MLVFNSFDHRSFTKYNTPTSGNWTSLNDELSRRTACDNQFQYMMDYTNSIMFSQYTYISLQKNLYHMGENYSPRRKAMNNLCETFSIRARRNPASLWFFICPTQVQEYKCTPVMPSGTISK